MSAAASTHLSHRSDSSAMGIALSLVLHGAIIGGAWWMSTHGPPPIDLNAKPIQAHLVRLGEKKEEKLLPRKEANVPPPEPEAVPIPSKPTPSVAEPPKPKVKTPTPVKDLKKDLFAAFDKNKPVTKPDKVTGQADGDAAGDVDTASEGEKYFGLVSTRIKRNYDVSSAIPDSERVRLHATVIIWIDAAGRVTKKEFQAQSGNDLFDSAVMSAVDKTSPFAPPPAALRTSLQRDGVALKFGA